MTDTLIAGLPTNYQGCRVIGHFTYSDGTPVAGGRFRLTPSPNNIRDTTSSPKVVILGTPVACALSDAGVIRGVYGTDDVEGIVIAASDDPDVNPTNFTYQFSFDDGQLAKSLPAFSFTAPFNQTVDLADVAPIPAAGGIAITVGLTGPAGPTGATGPADTSSIPLTQKAAASGVATLDAGTRIPVGQLPDLSGTYAPLGPATRPRLNVMDPAYGATGDGTTDDTAAIQAAITAAGSTRSVYFPPPPSFYRCGSGLTGGAFTHLLGEGFYFGAGGAGPRVKFDASVAVGFTDGGNNCLIENVMLDGGSSANGKIGLATTHNTLLNRVQLYNWGIGWQDNQDDYARHFLCEINACAIGISVIGSTTYNTDLYGFVFRATPTAINLAVAAQGLNLFGGSIEGYGSAGAIILGASAGSSQINLHDVYWESSVAGSLAVAIMATGAGGSGSIINVNGNTVILDEMASFCNVGTSSAQVHSTANLFRCAAGSGSTPVCYVVSGSTGMFTQRGDNTGQLAKGTYLDATGSLAPSASSGGLMFANARHFLSDGTSFSIGKRIGAGNAYMVATSGLEVRGAGVLTTDPTLTVKRSGATATVITNFVAEDGTTVLAQVLGSGVISGAGSKLGAGATHFSGTGAPGIAGAVGDMYWRIDTPTSTYAYICTVAGGAGAATWVALRSSTAPDVQTFTGSGTWTKPAGAVKCDVVIFGPGGGGSAGARGASGTALSGGGGGGGGAFNFMSFPASALTATVTVTVPAGGAGAAGQTVDSTAGAAGSSPASGTTFGAYLAAARGTTGAGGGLAAAGAAGGGGNGIAVGSSGGAGSAAGAAGTAGVTAVGAPGGGGGGGVTTAAAATAGGNGGVGAVESGTIATGGTAGGGAGNPGAASPLGQAGSGGSGGGGSTTGAGGTGGAGGTYGTGGGGGGASLNGSTSGAGGAGAGGLCVVTTYF